MQQFDNAQSHLKASGRFFIVTDNANPVYDNKQQRTAAKTNAEELTNKNVSIEPVFLTREGSGTGPFDMSVFWDDISFHKPSDASIEDALEDEPVPSGYFVSDKTIKISLLSRHTPKRALFTNQIELAPGLRIGVKAYLNFAKKKFMLPQMVYTGGEEKQVAKSEVKYTTSESARVIAGTNLKRAYKFGDTFVYFTPEQIQEIRNIEADRVIRIIGFKSPALIPFEYNKRSSTFIYPSEAQLTGSVRAFSSLYREMLSKNKVAIAWAKLRQSSIPEPVALYPVPEETTTIDGSTVQVTPPGFQLINLPYADDIRTRPPASCTQRK